MIIHLTKIENHDSKITVETNYNDMVLCDYARSPEEALREARDQIKLINYFRSSEE